MFLFASIMFVYVYDLSVWLQYLTIDQSFIAQERPDIVVHKHQLVTLRYHIQIFFQACIYRLYIHTYLYIYIYVYINIYIYIYFLLYLYLCHSISFYIYINIYIYIYIHSFVPMDGCHLWLFSPTPEALPRHSLGCEDCPRGGQGQDGVEKLWLVLGVLYPDGSLMSWGVPHLKCLMLFLTSRPFRVFLFLHISKKVHVLFWIWSKKKLARKPW